ncbi:Cdc37 family protein [Ostertagia ostertagi]
MLLQTNVSLAGFVCIRMASKYSSSLALQLHNFKEAALMNEYTSLKNLVDELNKEVAKFEQFKKEQDELEQKLLAKEAELAEKSARLAAAETEKQVLVVQGNGRSAELEVENAELRKKLAELEDKLTDAKKAQSDALAELAAAREQANEELEVENAELRKKLAELEDKLTDAKKAQSDALAELAAAREQANEEIVVLKRSQPVDAANVKSTNENDEEVVSLRAENNRLQQKNEELRKRNFKILDDVANLEKQLRERISSDSAAKPSPNKSYVDYVKGLAKSLKTALSEARISHEENETSSSNSGTQAELENYRSAFHSLSLLLAQIEMGVNERESFYKDKVAQLESELDKAAYLMESNIQQIQALRKCLGQPEEGKEIASSRSGTMKSDESDWEVVSR